MKVILSKVLRYITRVVTLSFTSLLVEVEDMKRGPGMRRIEKGDEEGYGGVAMNVCLGIQKIQHFKNRYTPP